MRKIATDFLHCVNQPPLRRAVVVLDDHNVVQEIGSQSDYDEATLDKRPGHIVPGFINAHCHLELSYMKGAIPEHTGLIPFVQQVVAIRDQFTLEQQQEAILLAEKDMLDNGIVAVGDISNDTRSFFQKAKGHLRYHTFVELFDLGPAMTEASKQSGIDVLAAVPQVSGHTASLTTHAPYSCTPDLFRWIDQYNRTHQLLGMSIHNQEQPDENQLFIDKTGDWLSFISHMQLDYGWFQPSGRSSLQTYVDYLHPNNRWLFIHNTFTAMEDIDTAHKAGQSIYWGFCPNANLYIENRLPDYHKFIQAGANCVLGTDSLASNHQLSIWTEMQTIHQYDGSIPFETLLQWGTLNGAECLHFEDQLGSIELGKQPGLVWLDTPTDNPLTTSVQPQRIA